MWPPPLTSSALLQTHGSLAETQLGMDPWPRSTLRWCDPPLDADTTIGISGMHGKTEEDKRVERSTDSDACYNVDHWMEIQHSLIYHWCEMERNGIVLWRVFVSKCWQPHFIHSHWFGVMSAIKYLRLIGWLAMSDRSNMLVMTYRG